MNKRNLFISSCFLLASGAISASAAIVGDINSDGRIDLTESIFALQVASGAYPNADTSCQLAGKGDWVTSTLYSECDVVKSGDSHYICTETHTSSPSFATDSTKWTKLILTESWGKTGNKIFYNDGNVGIGTNNPGSTLEVHGTIHTSIGGIKFPDDTIQTTASLGTWRHDNSRLYAYTNAGQFNLADNGNVGIGTVAPEKPFDVMVGPTNQGEPLARFFSTTEDVSLQINGQGGESYLEISNDDTTTSNSWKVGLNDANRLDFKYGDAHTMNTGSGLATVMAMTTTGNVGIGTEAPKSKLAVSGLPSGTSSSVVSGDTSGVAGAVCITNSGNMYIDTDGSCAD